MFITHMAQQRRDIYRVNEAQLIVSRANLTWKRIMQIQTPQSTKPKHLKMNVKLTRDWQYQEAHTSTQPANIYAAT